jgi:hypothetical protein
MSLTFFTVYTIIAKFLYICISAFKKLQLISHNRGKYEQRTIQKVFCLLYPKKICRLKEDQAFSLSLELGRREKVALYPSADFLLHSVQGEVILWILFLR